jgi:hypothetical protein
VPKVEVSRNCQIAESVLFLDGLTGTGKTMMAPILSTLRRVEVQRIEHIYEYVCALNFLRRIEDDAAATLVRMYVDLACYNVMIARESNFRWKDLSGVLSNPGGLRYVARLFQPGGDAVISRINRTRPILQIISHQVLGIASALFGALGDRLTVVEMVRHPLYLLQHWYSYIDRHGTDPRDFTIWFSHNGAHLPWFAVGWEDKYLTCNKMDRVIYTIDWLTRLAEETLHALDDTRRRQVLMVPFERFVADPWPYLQQISDSLGTTTTASTRRTLRKQKVPRRITIAGRDSEVYRRYDWEPPSKDSTEAAEMRKRWDHAVREATKEGLKVLERMCTAYEERYLRKAA